jgi:hypothetical protein
MHRNQNVVRADTTGGQRAIVLRPHDRKGLPICQAVSLHATREPGRSPGSDNGHYGNQVGCGRAGFSLRPINGRFLKRGHTRWDCGGHLGWPFDCLTLLCSDLCLYQIARKAAVAREAKSRATLCYPPSPQGYMLWCLWSQGGLNILYEASPSMQPRQLEEP